MDVALFALLFFVYMAILGLAGMKLAEVNGYDQTLAFWIAAVFGILGLIFLSTAAGDAETEADN